jgi:hypothetical protein
VLWIVLIPNEDLLALLGETGVRSNPVSAEQVSFTLRALAHSGIDADSASESSRSLQQLVHKQRSVLTPVAQSRLDSVFLFGLDTLLCDAIPKRYRSHKCILVHVGLLQLLRYYTDLQLAMVLLKDEKAEIDVGGEPVQIGLAASLAGHAILVAALDSSHQLISLSPLLGEVARQRSDYGYGAAALFLVLHELAHHELGHLDAGYKSERMAMEPRIHESIDPMRQMEVEADAFALQCFAPEIRAPVISSVMFAFGPFAFLEVFRGPMDAHHPLTVNRLAALAAGLSFSDEPELEQAAQSIVESNVDRFMRLASDRARGGGDVSHRIHEHLPLALAHEVLNHVGRWVREHRGTLDFDARQ